MGHGSYKASDWVKLKNSKGINSSSNASDIFRGNNLQDKYNPKFINVRESRDSADSPNSTPVILAFDVTGSMGYLAAEIAKNSLNKTAVEMYDKRPVTDPHIMCAAIESPGEGGLQVTQFEADIRVVEQLLELKVGFGGNTYSYDSLIWYFAAKHTSIDCYEKRGKKGFLFTIGDEICGANAGEKLSVTEIKNTFNDDVSTDLPLNKVYEMASEKYEIFHIVANRSSSIKTWEAFLPGRVAYISGQNIQYLSEVITSIMQIANGMKKSDAIAQWPSKAQPIVAEAIKNIGEKSSTPDNANKKPEEKKVIDEKSSTPNNVKKKSFFSKLFGR